MIYMFQFRIIAEKDINDFNSRKLHCRVKLMQKSHSLESVCKLSQLGSDQIKANAAYHQLFALNAHAESLSSSISQLSRDEGGRALLIVNDWQLSRVNESACSSKYYCWSFACVKRYVIGEQYDEFIVRVSKEIKNLSRLVSRFLAIWICVHRPIKYILATVISGNLVDPTSHLKLGKEFPVSTTSAQFSYHQPTPSLYWEAQLLRGNASLSRS